MDCESDKENQVYQISTMLGSGKPAATHVTSFRTFIGIPELRCSRDISVVVCKSLDAFARERADSAKILAKSSPRNFATLGKHLNQG